jgi:segregation and condensation protein A
MSETPTYTVTTPVYEGPMDLLLHIIREHEIELNEISLSEIARHFLQYARQVHTLDLDLAGEILYIATAILRMKARSLLALGRHEEEEEVEEPDLERSDELDEIYREIVSAARKLAEGETEQREHFTRGSSAEFSKLAPAEEALKDISLVQLAQAFRKVTSRLGQSDTRQLRLFEVTIGDQQLLILDALRQRVRVGFMELAREFTQRVEAVIAFLALLELLRSRKVTVRQDNLFEEVWIYRGPQYAEPEMDDEEDEDDGPDTQGAFPLDE